MFLILGLFRATLAGSGEVEFITKEQGYLFLEDSAPILFYQRDPKSFDGAYTRNNYVHPLWSLDGHILTEDGPVDHLHQRGIYWTWHQTYAEGTRLGDAWICEDFVWDVLETRIEDCGAGVKSLRVRVHWKSPDWIDRSGNLKPVVDEQTRITVYPAHNDHRAIDFEIALLALAKEVKIGGSEDEKGYGGFSARVKMPDDIRFESSGDLVQPETNALKAGSWINIVAAFGEKGEKSGLTIMCHPANPGDINRWILRDKGSMQNPVYPGREPVPISQDVPTVLKYRLILHRGSLETLTLEKLYQEYRHTP
jgi:hypothetical protein